MKGKSFDVNRNIRFLTSEYSILETGTMDLIEMDAGCGKGGFACRLASKYPDRTILAADVMLGRLRKLRSKTEKSGLQNVHILRADLRHLAGYMLQDLSIDRMHILCPDPWPKNKHAANRIMCSEFIGMLHRKLKAGGVLHFSTDDARYFSTVESLLSISGLFSRDDSSISDLDGVMSDFEILWHGKSRHVAHGGWIKLSI